MKRFLALLVISSAVLAEKAPKLRELPEGLSGADRSTLTPRRAALVERRAALNTKAKEHNARCTGVEEGSPRDAECRQEKKELEEEMSAYATDARAFNKAVTDAEVAFAVSKEQDEFDKQNAAWLKRQQEAIRQKKEAESSRLGELIRALDEPKPLPPLGVKDLQPGDVILVAPEPGLNELVADADYWMRLTRDFVEGKPEKGRVNISHSVACIRALNGRLYFLDHQSAVGKSEIIEEAEFQKRYGHRGRVVARPAVAVDGQKVWDAAMQASGKDPIRYGVVGPKLVCSEAIAFAVGKGIDKPLLQDRWGPIDLTPADFYDPDGAGKYFEFRPMEK